MQLQLFGNSDPLDIPIEDGKLVLFQKAFERDSLFEQLYEAIDWSQDEITLYGKTHPVPRLQRWYGPKPYQYSGIAMEQKQLPKELQELLTDVTNLSGYAFNSVLCNYYRTGSDYVAWHSDDEPELGKNPAVASLSLGGARRFQLKHKTNLGLDKKDIMLEHGDLLVMSGPLQHNWKHQIVKTAKAVEPRINLTFRNIL